MRTNRRDFLKTAAGVLACGGVVLPAIAAEPQPECWCWISKNCPAWLRGVGWSVDRERGLTGTAYHPHAIIRLDPAIEDVDRLMLLVKARSFELTLETFQPQYGHGMLRLGGDVVGFVATKDELSLSLKPWVGYSGI